MRKDAVFVVGEFYHVYNRGTRKSKIFLSESDYRRWEECLYWCNKFGYPYSLLRQQINQAKKSGRNVKEVVEQIEMQYRLPEPLVNVISYAHMPNHFHLVLRQNMDGGISKFMHKVSVSYAKYFNKKYILTGSLYEGNFRAVLIESEPQLLEVSRYVHTNPAVAGIVDAKGLLGYLWTSLRLYAGEEINKLVDTSYLLGLSNNNVEELVKFTLSRITDDNEGLLEGVTIDGNKLARK